MRIGPAPMMRTEWMSVRLGMLDLRFTIYDWEPIQWQQAFQLLKFQGFQVTLPKRSERLSAFGFFLHLAGHRHEAHRQCGSFFQPVSLLTEQYQFLVSRRPDGDDHLAAVLELLDQGLRHVLGRA